jgi:hypothetical protein
VSDHGFWAAQSLVTEPGPAAAAIDRLPADLGALRAASQQLVFHYWANGDYALAELRSAYRRPEFVEALLGA